MIALLSACSTQPAKQGQLIDNEYFSINWNSHSWNLNKDENPSRVVLSPSLSEEVRSTTVHVNYNQEYRGSSVSISSQPLIYRRFLGVFLPGSEMFFDQNADYSKVPRNAEGIPEMMVKNHGGRWFYNPKWDSVTYINGLKCFESTLITQSVKYVRTYCGYYDKVKGKRILYTLLKYDYKNNYLYADWEEAIKTDVPPSIQPIDDHLKDVLKKLLSTLKINNLDIERMQQEGLLHN